MTLEQLEKQYQLPLDFLHIEEKTFDQFILGPNSELYSLLNDPMQQFIFIWGDSYSGKTHILSALYQQYLSNNKTAIYIPLSSMRQSNTKKDSKQCLSIDILENIEQYDLVCIDDIDLIAGNKGWEEALFYLYNQMQTFGHKLVVSGQNNAKNTAFSLNDLKSRLQWGITYKIKLLEDADKIKILQNRAELKLFSLSDEVAQFFLNRVSRDLKDLIQLLDKLDYATLSEHRKLTIPFVKKVLGL